MRALAALVLTPLVTAAFLHVATSYFANPPLPTPPGTPSSLVWANRVFTTKAEFAKWLKRRDESYAHWLKMHPGASPWEPAARSPQQTAVAKRADQRVAKRGDEGLVKRGDEGVGVRSTLLAVVLALIGVLTVLAVRARDSIIEAVDVFRDRVAAGLRPALSPVAAGAGVRRLEVVQRGSRFRKRAVGEVPGRTFAEFQATVATMLQRPEAEPADVVEWAEEPVVRLVPTPRPSEPDPPQFADEPGLEVQAPPPKAKPRKAEPEPATDLGSDPGTAAFQGLTLEPTAPAPVQAPVREPAVAKAKPRRPEPEPVIDLGSDPGTAAFQGLTLEPTVGEPAPAPALEVAPPPPAKVAKPRKVEREQPAPEPAQELVPEPELVAPAEPAAPRRPRVAKPRARRRMSKAASAKTHVFCEITYSRGYVKGQFWARLWDVEGNPTVAKSELFASRSEFPDHTAESEAALEGLAQQLIEAGWEPYDDGRTWFGRWFAMPRSSGPPGLVD